MYRNWYRKLGGRKGVVSLGRSVGFKGSAISASGAQFRWSNRQLAFLETFQRLFSFWGEDKKKGKGERERRCKIDIPDFGNDSTFFFRMVQREGKKENFIFPDLGHPPDQLLSPPPVNLVRGNDRGHANDRAANRFFQPVTPATNRSNRGFPT